MLRTGLTLDIGPVFLWMEPVQFMCSLIKPQLKQHFIRIFSRITYYLIIKLVISFNKIVLDIILQRRF